MLYIRNKVMMIELSVETETSFVLNSKINNCKFKIINAIELANKLIVDWNIFRKNNLLIRMMIWSTRNNIGSIWWSIIVNIHWQLNSWTIQALKKLINQMSKVLKRKSYIDKEVSHIKKWSKKTWNRVNDIRVMLLMMVLPSMMLRFKTWYTPTKLTV